MAHCFKLHQVPFTCKKTAKKFDDMSLSLNLSKIWVFKYKAARLSEIINISIKKVVMSCDVMLILVYSIKLDTCTNEIKH